MAFYKYTDLRSKTTILWYISKYSQHLTTLVNEFAHAMVI